jgi:hypothetical protein
LTDEQGQEPQVTVEPVRVSVIGTQGHTTLVETKDRRRWYVPNQVVQDGRIEQQELDRAVHHGIQWEAYLQPVQVEDIAHQLRRRGIYTVDDLAERDRELIRIGTKLITRAVRAAAQQAAHDEPPKRK